MDWFSEIEWRDSQGKGTVEAFVFFLEVFALVIGFIHLGNLIRDEDSYTCRVYGCEDSEADDWTFDNFCAWSKWTALSFLLFIAVIIVICIIYVVCRCCKEGLGCIDDACRNATKVLIVLGGILSFLGQSVVAMSWFLWRVHLVVHKVLTKICKFFAEAD